MGNIYWREIKGKQKVKDMGTHFKVGKDTVFWHGHEADLAQHHLRAKAKGKSSAY